MAAATESVDGICPLPSSHWITVLEYAPCSHVRGPVLPPTISSAQMMRRFPNLCVGFDVKPTYAKAADLRRALFEVRAHSPLIRLVRSVGIYPLPSSDWST